MLFADPFLKPRQLFLPAGWLAGAFCITAFLSACKNEVPLSQQQHTEWKDYGGGPDHSKFVDFKQLTKDNVGQLQLQFIVPTYDNEDYKFNPVIVDNVMYVIGRDYSIIAVDATTGKELWIHKDLKGIIFKGINFWQSEDKKQKRLIIFLNNTMQALDASTGKSILDFGETGKGYTDMRLGVDRDPETLGRMTSVTPGHIYKDLVIVGSAPGEELFVGPGHLRAYNVLTGKLVWVFHTIPHPGEPGYETWPKDAYKFVGGANTWGEISVDADRGIAYFPIGSPTYDYDGADRAGDDLYGNCLLALDAKTGKHLWHFQTVHHDLWDYDLTAAPQLITVNHDGKKVDAVAVAGKTGFLYVFNRVTGEPLWPIEERPVPPSEMPDEKSSPTQPFPTVVPPFNRQVITENDLNPFFTAEVRDKWIARIKAGKSGLFQPLSDKYETFAMPGSVGGVNYGNTAANPDSGIVYVITQELPVVYKLRLGKYSKSGGNRLAKAAGIYVQTCQACHGADRNGLAGAGPSLAKIGEKATPVQFKQILRSGRGRMPAMPHLDDSTISTLYAFLAGGRGMDAKTVNSPRGPVADSGGVEVPAFPPKKDVGYPQGYTGPKSTHQESHNWGENAPDLLTPAWSWIVAYDLNKGTIKWKVPLGNVDSLQSKTSTGVPGGSQGKGMIITSTGLVFASCKDGRVYAYDADDGHTLWSGELGRTAPNGIPAMYMANGKQYIVVCSTGPLTDKNKDVPKGYAVFALPDEKK